MRNANFLQLSAAAWVDIPPLQFPPNYQFLQNCTITCWFQRTGPCDGPLVMFSPHTPRAGNSSSVIEYSKEYNQSCLVDSSFLWYHDHHGLSAQLWDPHGGVLNIETEGTVGIRPESNHEWHHFAMTHRFDPMQTFFFCDGYSHAARGMDSHPHFDWVSRHVDMAGHGTMGSFRGLGDLFTLPGSLPWSPSPFPFAPCLQDS